MNATQLPLPTMEYVLYLPWNDKEEDIGHLMSDEDMCMQTTEDMKWREIRRLESSGRGRNV